MDLSWSNFVHNPHQYLKQIKNIKSQRELYDYVANYINENIQDPENYQQIPSIFANLKSVELSNFSFVKYQCLVRDVLSSDYCIIPFSFLDHNSEQDKTVNDFDFDYSKFSDHIERKKYFVVDIPCHVDWISKQNQDWLFTKPTLNIIIDQSKKRSLEKDDTNGFVKKIRNQNNADDQSLICSNHANSSYLFLNQGCVLYTFNQKNDLKLNEMIEVFGIIELPASEELKQIKPNPQNSNIHNAFDLESDEDFFPHATYFRVHSLFCRPLKNLITIPEPERHWLTNSENILKIRSELISIFTRLLFNDEISSEFLLSCLISKVYVRHENYSIGSFPLNLMNLPKMSKFETKSYIEFLFRLLSFLVPISFYYELTIENLNKDNLEPKKNSNFKLIPGKLHLPNGSLLLIDETMLKTGELNTTGVQNIQAINNLIKFQTINIYFDYYKTQGETNVNILSISEGKSILSFNCHLPLKASQDQDLNTLFNDLNNFITPDLFNKIRYYLSYVREMSFEIPTDTQNKIAEEFVQMRQESLKTNNRITADDFQTMINLARLLSISYGHSELANTLWLRTLYLEDERKRRLNSSLLNSMLTF